MAIDFDLVDSYKHKGLRRQLSLKVRQKGIKDERIIRAIEKVPRHFFLDSAFAELAYEDQAMQIGEGQTISQPYTVAFQTELLNVRMGDKILEIGTGSGYQACILIELGAVVYSVERIAALSETASKLLPLMGYNPKLFVGDGSIGLEAHAPFDKIIVTAAAPEVPQALMAQLKTGGTLVIPIGDKHTQMMYKITKSSENELLKEAHNYFRFVPLIGQGGWNG
jgi:protein-L-isoaspartate(D-aspartate) O-methyltransferase